MKFHHLIVLLVLFALFSREIKGQNAENFQSIKIGAGLPFPITNKEFRQNFKGVYHARLSADLTAAGHLLIGTYLQHTYFDNADPTVKSETTRNPNWGAGLSIGFKKQVGDRSYMNTGLNFGWVGAEFSESDTRNDSLIVFHKENTWGVDWNLNYNIIIEEKRGVGFYLRIHLVDLVFDPEMIGYDEPFSNTRSSYLTTGFLFSFGK